jgi:hypothetical protein
MKRISSKRTMYYKRVFPGLWFGLLAFGLVLMIAARAFDKVPFVVIVPCVMAVFGYIVMKKLAWDLADEVFDCGDRLLVRKGGEQEDVLLANIMNVSASTLVNPPQITIRLLHAGRFGEEVAFSPSAPFSLNPFAKNAVAEDLIVRVDAARARRAVELPS